MTDETKTTEEPEVCDPKLWICDETGDDCRELDLEITTITDKDGIEHRLGPFAAVVRACHAMLDADEWTHSPYRQAEDTERGIYNLVRAEPLSDVPTCPSNLVGFIVIEYRLSVHIHTGTSGLREYRRREVTLIDESELPDA